MNLIHSVVVLPSFRTEAAVITSDTLGGNRDTRKPVDFIQFVEAERQPGPYGLGLKQAPPV